MIDGKMKELERILSGFGKVAIAFSGGVDSTFLLSAATRLLGKDNVTAITVVPPYVAGWEIEEAEQFADDFGINHIKMKTAMIDEVKNNPDDRCYLCKRALFSSMKEKAASLGISYLCDGSNADDTSDYRPGMRALKELGINSPLLKAGLTKDEIRLMSKEWELPTWDKPPYACLLTRIPHNEEVTDSVLKLVEKSEVIMMDEGFPYVRVRHHGEIARIEIPRSDFDSFMSEGHYETVSAKMRELGYRYVTLDLEGYKMGNMNPKAVSNG